VFFARASNENVGAFDKARTCHVRKLLLIMAQIDSETNTNSPLVVKRIARSHFCRREGASNKSHRSRRGDLLPHW
jgi:hypothetical protein